MELKDAHIVLDGANLALRRGTGIKAYGLTLARALTGMGARVSVLWSGRANPVPLVREAMLYDRRPKGAARGSRGSAAMSVLRTLVGGAAPAVGHAPTRLVISDQPEDDLAGLAHRYYMLPGCFGAANRLFRASGIALRARFPDRVDVWHATCPLPLKVRGARNVTTVHDLIPLRLPWATLDDRQLFYKTVRRALSKSALVIAVSEHTKKDLVDVFNVAPDRIHVTYEPCLFAPGPAPEPAGAGGIATYGLRPKEYVLFVGAIEPKKNVGRLLLAWRALEANIPLVIVGGKGWLWKDELKPAGPLLASRRVILVDYAPREHLRRLYAGALFFAFPSLYEGFGLPPLEAMTLGCPVLTSSVSSLPEICGDGALYCDPYSLDDLADKMRALLGDDALRRRLADAGRARAAFFSMENYQRRLAEAYGKMPG